jgi:hypothetical protein
MYRMRVWIESMLLWEGSVDEKFELPSGVVTRIADQTAFALTHGARVPRVEIAIERIAVVKSS